MANIFLTRKCNLKCPYCFADEFVNKNNEEITIDNFKKALEFIKTDKNERIGLIGGEPLLHSDIRTILNIIQNDDTIKNIIIYTNGLEIDKHIDILKGKKFHFLINCNSPKDIGEERYNKLKENINLLASSGNKEFTLGINLYSKNMDYSFIFELIKLTDEHRVRFSTALPNSSKEDIKDVLKSFTEIKPFLFDFFEDCLKNKIVPNNDCNSLPICLLSTEDKRLLLKFNILANEFKIKDTINTSHTCNPVIDILPDLYAVRCFGLSKYIKANIQEYSNVELLRKYFYNKIDLYARLCFAKKDCEDCKYRLIEKCGICFTYKMKTAEILLQNCIKNCMN